MSLSHRRKSVPAEGSWEGHLLSARGYGEQPLGRNSAGEAHASTSSSTLTEPPETTVPAMASGLRAAGRGQRGLTKASSFPHRAWCSHDVPVAL